MRGSTDPGLLAARSIRTAGFAGSFNLLLRADVGLGLLQIHFGASYAPFVLFG